MSGYNRNNKPRYSKEHTTSSSQPRTERSSSSRNYSDNKYDDRSSKPYYKENHRSPTKSSYKDDESSDKNSGKSNYRGQYNKNGIKKTNNYKNNNNYKTTPLAPVNEIIPDDKLLIDPTKHKLNDVWCFWHHNDNDQWDRDSYRKILEFGTVEDFWGLYNYIPSVVNGMFFLMRKQRNGHLIAPSWEDPVNRNGGSWSFKVYKVDADNAWLGLSMYLIGETLCSDPLDLVGISISPKKQFVTIRVWNIDSNKKDQYVTDFPADIPHLDFSTALYRINMPED